MERPCSMLMSHNQNTLCKVVRTLSKHRYAPQTSIRRLFYICLSHLYYARLVWGSSRIKYVPKFTEKATIALVYVTYRLRTFIQYSQHRSKTLLPEGTLLPLQVYWHNGTKRLAQLSQERERYPGVSSLE